MRDLSVTCNALWEQFKMVDDKKTVSFFKISYIHKLSHKELLYYLRIQMEKYYICVWIYQDMSLENHFSVPIF